jgi:hypothetical protein
VFSEILLVELFPQPEIARTVMLPEVKGLFTKTSILVPPFALAKVTLAGTVHVYDNALGTGAIEYVTVLVVPLKAHTLLGPLIKPGVAGVARVIAILRLSLPLHPETTTDTLPLEKDEANLKLIEEVPWPLTLVAPEGIVHK